MDSDCADVPLLGVLRSFARPSSKSRFGGIERGRIFRASPLSILSREAIGVGIALGISCLDEPWVAFVLPFTLTYLRASFGGVSEGEAYTLLLFRFLMRSSAGMVEGVGRGVLRLIMPKGS